MLTLGGLIAGFSITRMWADETWGPRYLHATIAPLVLCLAAAKSAMEFRWKRELLTAALLVLGIAFSLLGSFFPYVSLHNAATQSSQATLEALQYNPDWNHLRFNWQLMKVWVRGSFGDSAKTELWPPSPHWWFTKPDDAPQEKTADLRASARPQPLLAQVWRQEALISPRVFGLLRGLMTICLIAGLVGCGLVWRQARTVDEDIGN